MKNYYLKEWWFFFFNLCETTAASGEEKLPLSMWVVTITDHAKSHSCFFFKKFLFLCTWSYLQQVGSSLTCVGSFSCRIWDLVSWPGIKPGHLALGTRSFGCWTTREVHLQPLLSKMDPPTISSWGLNSRQLHLTPQATSDPAAADTSVV